ncbi:MAG: hypothetical protein ABI416_15495 [Ginsengibacter sp.]
MAAKYGSAQQLHSENTTDPPTFKSLIDKRTDFGRDFSIGFQHQERAVTAKYNFDLNNTLGAIRKFKNRNLTLPVGCYFIKN